MRDLSKEFLKEIGFKPYMAALINTSSNEVRLYKNKSSIYRLPKGWSKKYVVSKLFTIPLYPYVFHPINFINILRAQWEVIGSIGGGYYVKQGNESFEESYIKIRLEGIRVAKSLGGGNVLDSYIKRLNDIEWIMQS